MRSLCALLVLCIAATAQAEPGDKLYVQGNKVNVRAGPSTATRVLAKVDTGQELVEVDRKKGWIKAGITGQGGLIAWISGTLVGADMPADSKIETAKSPAFAKFDKAFSALIARIKRRRGTLLFAGAEDRGDGIIQITATDTWLSAPLSDRQSNLSTIFDLWDAAEGSGLPIAVVVVNGTGKQVMHKFQR